MGSSELLDTIFLKDLDLAITDNENEVEGEKALLQAAVQGDYNKIEELLKSGISVNAKEYNKILFCSYINFFTPLQLASFHGHEQCVQLLIDHGADVNATDYYGFTPLHFAAYSGCYNILKILLRTRASCSLPIKFNYSAPLKYSEGTRCTKVPYLRGTTPLHIAASTNHVDCVKELIHYGADFNAVDEHGRTSLYIAAQYGHSECALVHLKEAVGRDILSLPSLKTSDTPLHFAVKYQMIDCVKELLRLGSDVSHRNFDGLSPLHTAILPLKVNSNTSDLMTVLKLLVLEGHDTDINQPDWDGFTPLHYACFYGHRNMWSRRPEIATFLISYGANVDIKDCTNCSLLVRELKDHPEEDFEVLRYLVKSVLHLPRLKSLNITLDKEPKSVDESQQPALRNPQETENRPDFFENAIPYHPFRRGPEDYFALWDEFDGRGLMRRPLMQPLRRTNTLRPVARARPVRREGPFVIESVAEAMNLNADRDRTENITNGEASLILKKQLWYEEIASSPRTLQHHCRFLIRKVLGPKKLKHITKLPLPSKLHSYLLFELQE